MPDYPFVAFACNDAHGNVTFRVSAINVENLIYLDGDAAYAEDHQLHRVQIDGAWFSVKSVFTPYTGNIFWNGVRMHPSAVSGLLMHLRESGEWAMEEAISEIWDLWEKGSLIEEGDVRDALKIQEIKE